MAVLMTQMFLYVYSSMNLCPETVHARPQFLSVLKMVNLTVLNKSWKYTE